MSYPNSTAKVEIYFKLTFGSVLQLMHPVNTYSLPFTNGVTVMAFRPEVVAESAGLLNQ